MGTNPGNDKSYLRDEGAVRRAAMMVVGEFGENAAAYAVTRAIVLQKTRRQYRRLYMAPCRPGDRGNAAE